MDYTKFKLKPEEEILSILEDKDNIFIINCAKCYKEFTEIEDEECGELTKIIREHNKKIVGCMPVNFLCNKFLTEKILKARDELHNKVTVVVNSCGLGIQTVADIVDSEVCSVANSVPQGGYHGMALSIEKCQACSDCVLSYTGGICPITDCSKSLLNGSCGGAKNGKCEISPDKDCAWEKIYKRLESLGKLDIMKQFFKIRNYNKPDFKTTNVFNTSILEKRQQNFYGGVYPDENKEYTMEKSIVSGPEPDIVVIPLSQHTGAICEPLVKTGDRVKTGQKIGDSKSFISAPVHSSVTGKVIGVETRKHPLIESGILSVIIKPDAGDEYDSSVEPYKDWENLSREEIIDIIHQKGIAGLGGAQFPTYVKLKSPKPIDTLIINGCECEPYLTCDYRIMIERPDNVISGMKILMKALNVSKGYIAVENNKPEAVKILKDKSLEFKDNIEIVELNTKYPQGAEKMLIKKVLGRQVPRGGLPLDVGVVVNNVGTAVAVSDAINKGLPLIKRVITVTGQGCIKPGNYEIRIGTSFQDIINYCFDKESSISDSQLLIKMGGPMMGILQQNIDIPVIKGTTGILAMARPDIEPDLSRECIKCGRCADVCPMELLPLYYGFYTKKQQYKETEKYPVWDVLDCIECGCCDYVCPSKISLVSSVKKIKKVNRTKYT